MANYRPDQIKTELSRDLGLTSALAIGIGTMIAAGIFTLSGLAIRNVGSGAIASFLLAAVVALFTALSYCEFVSIYPQTGEGYLYARKTFKSPLAYFMGWSLFLGYTSSCAFYIASLSSYFNEFIWHSPVEALSGIAMLTALILINIKGTRESGRFQVIVTAVKVVLLIWFIAGGLRFVNMAEVMERFSTDLSAIGSTAALVFITFFGFSAIAASAGEVKNPVKNVTRAIFISMVVVTLLYTAVVLVLLFAGLENYTEASMGDAAVKFLGSFGGYIIIGGALFSMISASNASVMAGSRVLLSMSQLGHMPREMGLINKQTRTPVIAVLLVGGAILVFALVLPLEDLSYFANTVLLLALVTVNIALILHRRKFPDIKRPFKVPLVPLLPILGILANVYLIIQIFQHPVPLALALAALITGFLGFVAWKGRQPAEQAIEGPSSVVALSEGIVSPEQGAFRVLVPVANPATMERLIQLATALVREKSGEILLLQVITIPEQLPPSRVDRTKLEKEKLKLGKAREICEGLNVQSQSVIRIGYDVARAILETSTEWKCDAIVLGWKGYSNSRQKILGTITDAVVKNAHADIMIVKFVGDDPIKKILLPTAESVHAKFAEQYCTSIAKMNAGSVTLCKVIPENPRPQKAIHAREWLQKAVARMTEENGGIPIDRKLIYNNSIVDGIIEKSRDFDAVMVGATRKGFAPQLFFGNIPEKIAKGTNKTVIMVKHYDRVQGVIQRVLEE